MSLIPYFFEKPFRALSNVNDSYQSPFLTMNFISPMLNHLNSVAQEFNSTINSDKNKFQVNLDVQHFAPEEITVKTADGYVVVEGKHEEKEDEHGYVSRQFIRRYGLPEGCLPDMVESSLSSDGVLTVTAPRVLALPDEGERIVPIQRTGLKKLQ